jgi:hypothetical protein
MITDNLIELAVVIGVFAVLGIDAWRGRGN